MPGKPRTARRYGDRGLHVLAGGVAALVCAIYGRFLFGNELFVFTRVGSDTYHQYWPVDRYLGELLRSGHLTSWTFRAGLGKQIFLSPSLLNPFVLLVELLPPAVQPSGYVFKMILECVCAAFLWRRYLGALGMSGWTAVVFPLLYGFNGYLVLWGQHAIFGIVFSLVPLTLWAYEDLLRGRRWWPLVLSLTAFLVTSWYFFVMFSVFFSVFAGVRAASRPGTGLREVIRVYVRLGLCYGAALLLSAWTILPTVSYLATSPRIVARPQVGLLAFFPLPDYAGLLRIYSNNVFGVDVRYRGPLNYYELPQLACGLLTLLLLPQFFALAPRRERRWAAATLGLVGLSLVSPFVAQAFVGFTAPTYRHSFVWIVFCLYLAAWAFHRLETGGELHRGVLATTVAGLSLPAALAAGVAVGVGRGVVNVPEGLAARGLALMQAVRPQATAEDFALALKTELVPVLATEMGKVLAVIGAYAAVLVLLRTRRRHAIGALLAITFVELVLLDYPTVNQRATLSKDYTRQHAGYFDATDQALRSIRAADDTFYRVDKTFRSVFLNDPLFQGYFGTSSYAPVNEPSTLAFLQALEVPTYEGRGVNYFAGFGDRGMLNSLVGVKYVLSKEPLERSGHRRIGVAGDVLIHLNERALPLGFVYGRHVDPVAFAGLTPRLKDLALLLGSLPGEALRAQPALLKSRGRVDLPPAALDEAALEKRYVEAVGALRREPFVISDFREDRIRGRVSSREGGMLFLSIPFNRGWRATVDGHDELVHCIDVGFVGIPLAAGSHAVEVRFVPEGSRPGLAVSLLAAIACVLVLVRTRRASAPGAPPTPGPSR